jgi:dethiobiotin synthetase
VIDLVSERGVFVTGTDTGVGKTISSAALSALFREAGSDAVPMKPIQTGGLFRDGEWVSPDLSFCLRMANLAPDPTELADMAPYVFQPACSPHLAASRTGRHISCERIASSFARLSKRHDLVVVEGAGGVLVPIDRNRTMLDLMKLLDLPVVLVARPLLGTLNHTLLSLRELDRAGLSVVGVVFCETRKTRWGFIEKDNWKTVERFGKVQVVGRVPYMDGLEEGFVSPERFRRAAVQFLEWPKLSPKARERSGR